ncbi:MAG: competence protein ComEC [Blastocatellia bacterium]|nr:competence protein ComEC [Blastocatellia bacterium]
MSKKTKGCGCSIAVLVVVLIAGGIGLWKFGLSWWKTRLPPPSGAELQVHVLDVGPVEGDAILIISPGGKSVLIDAGDRGKGKVVLDALKRYNVQTLDYFIATHPHPDHIGGAAEVLKGIKVATVIDNGVDLSTPVPTPTPGKQSGKGAAGKTAAAKEVAPKQKGKAKSINSFFDEYKEAISQSGAQHEKAELLKKYDLGGGARLTVLGPSEPLLTADKMKAGGSDTNANSIVLRLDYGDFSMLLMGDAEAQTEQRLLGKDIDLKAKVLKVAHHGSKYATSQDFINRVKPEVAIISDGAWNRYGHPAQVVLERLRTAGVKVYRTDLQSEITVTSRGTGNPAYSIKPAKEADTDVWLGREAQKDDSSRSGFVAYGDFGPPPKPKPAKGAKK